MPGQKSSIGNKRPGFYMDKYGKPPGTLEAITLAIIGLPRLSPLSLYTHQWKIMPFSLVLTEIIKGT